MFAIQEAKRAGLLNFKNIYKNFLPGVVVGVVALPLAMAFAIASGVKPEHGLYTAIVAGLCVSMFGGSRVQVAGPTGAFVVILASVTQRHGIEGLQMATLMAGIILLGMGLARLGSIIKYIPDPVIVGFTTGVAVVIWVGQWKDFFGLKVTFFDHHFHAKLFQLIKAFPSIDGWTSFLALTSLLVLVFVRRYFPKWPSALLALIWGTTIQGLFVFPSIATIGSAFGGIPQTLPSFQWPNCSFARSLELVGPAFTIALLGAIESLLSAVVADGMLGTRHSSNQELIGQGIANIFSPLLGGFAATGAIARTATNVRNGGNSPVAGIIHAITLILLILLLAPLASHIPLATLSAVLFVVAYNMSEIPRFMHLLRRAPAADGIVLLVTCFLTVFGDLVVAVNVGVILATLLFMRRMAKSVQIELHNAALLKEEISLEALPLEVVVYSIDGPFFFGAVETFENAISNIGTNIRTLIVRLKRVPFIDATGLETIRDIVQTFEKHGTKVIFCEANKRVHEKMKKAQINDSVSLSGLDRDLKTTLKIVNVL